MAAFLPAAILSQQGRKNTLAERITAMLSVRNRRGASTMTSAAEARLTEMGLQLPTAAPPKVAKIRGWKRWDRMLFISGAVPKLDGAIQFVGKLGREFDLATGQAAAQLSALNMLAQAKEALNGDLDQIEQVLKLNAFINATPDFTQIPDVANGASELFIRVYGTAGEHARTAVGVAVMPFDVAIEVEGLFIIREAVTA